MVTGGKATQIVVYPARISSLKDGTLVASGAEQTVVQYVGVGRISGYIDLGEMGAGDTIKIRQYMKLKSDSNYQKYAEETYSGVQSIPIIYITAKESDYGVKVTLQQTVGLVKSFDYNFLKEV